MIETICRADARYSNDANNPRHRSNKGRAHHSSRLVSEATWRCRSWWAEHRRRKTLMAKLTGGGIQGNKNVNVGVRTGTGSKGSSPGAADQIGQSVAFKKDKIDGGPGFNPTKYGNEVALNSKSAPGQGRTIHGCGSQGTHGSPAPGSSPAPRDILSSFGPERSKGG